MSNEEVPVRAPEQGDGGSVPRWHTTHSVTTHESHVYLRLGFSEIRLDHADTLILAGELLEACGYTYVIERVA